MTCIYFPIFLNHNQRNWRRRIIFMAINQINTLSLLYEKQFFTNYIRISHEIVLMLYVKGLAIRLDWFTGNFFRIKRKTFSWFPARTIILTAIICFLCNFLSFVGVNRIEFGGMWEVKSLDWKEKVNSMKNKILNAKISSKNSKSFLV